jgi:hypothetical protein
MDPFNHLAAKQRRLLEERDGLVLRILALPDLKNFIMTPFVTLHSAASRGPVVIINHTSDAPTSSSFSMTVPLPLSLQPMVFTTAQSN